MTGWHHQRNGHELGQNSGDGEGQGGLVCCSPWDSQELSQAPQFESIYSLVLGLLSGPALTSIYDYWKKHASSIETVVSKVMSLLSNTMSSFVVVFLPRSKHLLFS